MSTTCCTFNMCSGLFIYWFAICILNTRILVSFSIILKVFNAINDQWLAIEFSACFSIWCMDLGNVWICLLLIISVILGIISDNFSFQTLYLSNFFIYIEICYHLLRLEFRLENISFGGGWGRIYKNVYDQFVMSLPLCELTDISASQNVFIVIFRNISWYVLH